jgi:signal transduction histidine kinase
VATHVGRRELAALAAATVVASILHTDLFLLLSACVPLALTGRWLRGWIVGQLGLTVAVGLAIAGTPDFEPIFQAPHLPASLLVALTLAAVVAWQGLGFAVGSMAAAEARGRIELERTLGDLAATRELLSGTARLAERLRIARDLHDVVGHHLAALSVSLDLAARRADGPTAEAVREAHTVTRLLLQDVREVVHDLRGAPTLDLRAALVRLAEAVHEPAVVLDLPETLEVDPLRTQALYRCVQEGLTNAVRHGRARRVSIRVTRDARSLLLEIADDGRGAHSITPGLGLRGMRERVEECGGALTLETRSGAGLRLRVALPEPVDTDA